MVSGAVHYYGQSIVKNGIPPGGGFSLGGYFVGLIGVGLLFTAIYLYYSFKDGTLHKTSTALTIIFAWGILVLVMALSLI